MQFLNLRRFKTVNERRQVLEKIKGLSLRNISYYSLDEKIASSRNCENMIGVAQVPLGVAGPIKIKSQTLPPGKGKLKKQDFYIPLATTEGALVASVNRGCKAISDSGGAIVLVEQIGATRGPVFRTSSVRESAELVSWLEGHFNDLSRLAEQTSPHLRLKKMEPQIVGKNVYVRFYFDTGEAMGMNMATFATNSVIQNIEQQTGYRCISLSANFCVDKKPAWLNFIKGRGKRVWAESVIKKEVIEKVLKTTSEKIFEVWLNKCLVGSALSGSLGFNDHFANVLAAIFLATGQDLAHVVEGAVGITMAEIEDKGDLSISVYLPDLMVGTIGGGTGLGTQKEALEITGIKDAGKGGSLTLAGVIGGAVLAGELSLLASLAEGSLAEAHQKLARGVFNFN